MNNLHNNRKCTIAQRRSYLPSSPAGDRCRYVFVHELFAQWNWLNCDGELNCSIRSQQRDVAVEFGSIVRGVVDYSIQIVDFPIVFDVMCADNDHHAGRDRIGPFGAVSTAENPAIADDAAAAVETVHDCVILDAYNA